jgi:hypothetical protein
MPSIESLEPRIAPATFIVTNLNPLGSGSLRDAIVQANENPGSDLIVFRKGLTGTIAVGGGDMKITDTLTIKGPGASKLTLDANFTSRIFSVSDDDPERDSPLTVSGLMFFRGSDPNQGTSGGAIQSVESLKIRRCAFIGNQARNSGGAIELTHGDGAPLGVDIRGSSFVLNSGTNTGGALALSVSDNLILKNNLFASNFADTTSGAVNLASGSAKPVLVQNCQFLGNNTDELAGAGTIESSTVIVRDCLFNVNHSGQSVGGLELVGKKIVIDGSAFIQNTAEENVGGLNVIGFDSAVIHSSRFLGNVSVLGGGVRVETQEGAVARILSSTISGNTAAQGGGILLEGGSGRVEIIACRITNNQTESDGGGILVSAGSLEFRLIASKVVGNLSEEGFGGGIALRTASPAFIVSSIIAKNLASLGGGISVIGKLTLNDSTVTGNIATVLIGGILIGAQTPVLNGTNVIGNVSPDGVQIGDD